jgi:hypothetical protein
LPTANRRSTLHAMRLQPAYHRAMISVRYPSCVGNRVASLGRLWRGTVERNRSGGSECADGVPRPRSPVAAPTSPSQDRRSPAAPLAPDSPGEGRGQATGNPPPADRPAAVNVYPERPTAISSRLPEPAVVSFKPAARWPQSPTPRPASITLRVWHYAHRAKVSTAVS